MADNYLERKMEQLRVASARPLSKQKVSLDALMAKNRSVNGYDSSYRVRADQLRRIVAVNDKLPFFCSCQVFSFRLVVADEAGKVLSCIAADKVKGAWLPTPGNEPNAFVVICSVVEADRDVLVGLGISLQSMLLQAVEIGLNGTFLLAFDSVKLKEVLSLPCAPLAVLAVGKRVETLL